MVTIWILFGNQNISLVKWLLIISLRFFFLILPTNFYDIYMQYFGHLMWRNDSLEKNPDAGKDWRQEEKGMT